MNRQILSLLLSIILILSFGGCSHGKIDREALVKRHNIETADLKLQIPLGNGNICFTVDGVGLQNFGGNILSHDCWHTSPLPEGFTVADVPETGTFQQERCTPHTGDIALPAGAGSLRKWMYDNPHIANLGRLRFVRNDGREITPEEITGLHRSLNLWTGVHISAFILDGEKVSTETYVAASGAIHFSAESRLLDEQKLLIALDFPYPDETKGDSDGNFNAPDKHSSHLEPFREGAKPPHYRKITHSADNMHYTAVIDMEGTSECEKDPSTPHRYFLKKDGKYSITLFFSSEGANIEQTAVSDRQTVFPEFWKTGGAIDLSQSADPRWKELERRIVLSQYLMRVNSAGTLPSGESGLMMTDRWRGQFHYEMLWWHLAHYALWDRLEYSDDALQCYWNHKPVAQKLAAQLGYKGYKWGKSCGWEGRTAPWVGNQVLLWKQPHPMFFAELEYRNRPTRATLEKWADILEGTAENMADYVAKDGQGVYHLNPVMPPSEQGITADAVFDLAYWRFGLDRANLWRERLGNRRNPLWDEIVRNLAPLPAIDTEDGRVFVHSAEWADTYTVRNWEHPDPVGVLGMLPALDGVDSATAARTVVKIAREWNWNRCWGWDFPWMAMASARTDNPHLAVDMLLHDSGRNSYDERGLNGGWYLPGNGGLLYAVAMMAAGWDGAPAGVHAPGFPQDGSWTVRFEGLKKAP
ncbi:MAG: hypothetical protein LBL07_07130 [Tannerella sp.]|nr:hypothetical protein [Tannerella sp.]